jgi:hypothetical protein
MVRNKPPPTSPAITRKTKAAGTKVTVDATAATTRKKLFQPPSTRKNPFQPPSDSEDEAEEQDSDDEDIEEETRRLKELVGRGGENSDEDIPNHQGNIFLKIAASKQDNRKAPPPNNKEVISIESGEDDSDEESASDPNNSDADSDDDDVDSATTAPVEDTQATKTATPIENGEDTDANYNDASDMNNTTKNNQDMETDSNETDNTKNIKKKKENKKKTATVNTDTVNHASEAAAEKTLTDPTKKTKAKKKVQVNTDEGANKRTTDKTNGAETVPEQPTTHEPTPVDIKRDCRYNAILTIPPRLTPGRPSLKCSGNS